MILAAGAGNRMQPLTSGRAKPSLPVLGTPLVARAARDDLCAQRIGAEQPVGAVLLGRADGNDDGLRGREIGFNFRPGGKVELHQSLSRISSLASAFFHAARSRSTSDFFASLFTCTAICALPPGLA